jgi:hypothetical protein
MRSGEVLLDLYALGLNGSVGARTEPANVSDDQRSTTRADTSTLSGFGSCERPGAESPPNRVRFEWRELGPGSDLRNRRGV